MRILCLTARLPHPPNRGDRLRAYNFIKSLARQHELHLVSFISHDDERANIKPLNKFCQDVRVVHVSRARSILSVGTNIWRSIPLQAIYYRSEAMQHLVDQKLSEVDFDAAYIHLFRMAPYLAHSTRLYRIVDLTDVISREIERSLSYRSIVSRLIYTIEKPRIQRYERFVANTFEEVWLISEADRQALATICPSANIQVVTNGIDTDRFYPTGIPILPNSLIFTGHMGVAHNVDAATQLAQHVLPLIQKEIPDCTLQIIGAEPLPIIQKLALNPTITVTGYVPDLNDYLNRAALFVAPLRFAAGVQNKVLEAMATARPVITTSIVNEGLGAIPGKEIIIADTSQELAEQVVILLRDQALASNIGQNGMNYVRQKYSWNMVLERVNSLRERSSYRN
jgi:sugar transferase (PEP-CTERM/EpsH1 system associated)